MPVTAKFSKQFYDKLGHAVADMGEFFLPYNAVRTAKDPGAALMAFLESTYRAVADLAQWNCTELEVPDGFPRTSA